MFSEEIEDPSDTGNHVNGILSKLAAGAINGNKKTHNVHTESDRDEIWAGPSGPGEITAENFVVTGTLSRRLSCKRQKQGPKTRFPYELHFSLCDPACSVFVFSKGRINIVGIQRREDIPLCIVAAQMLICNKYPGSPIYIMDVYIKNIVASASTHSGLKLEDFLGVYPLNSSRELESFPGVYTLFDDYAHVVFDTGALFSVGTRTIAAMRAGYAIFREKIRPFRYNFVCLYEFCGEDGNSRNTSRELESFPGVYHALAESELSVLPPITTPENKHIPDRNTSLRVVALLNATDLRVGEWTYDDATNRIVSAKGVILHPDWDMYIPLKDKDKRARFAHKVYTACGMSRLCEEHPVDCGVRVPKSFTPKKACTVLRAAGYRCEYDQVANMLRIDGSMFLNSVGCIYVPYNGSNRNIRPVRALHRALNFL